MDVSSPKRDVTLPRARADDFDSPDLALGL